MTPERPPGGDGRSRCDGRSTAHRRAGGDGRSRCDGRCIVDRRAVSDLVGFALVFALVTASIAMVYVAGIQGLQDARRDEQLRNVERAFDVFDDNVEDIHRRDAPSRATEISLLNGQMTYGRAVNVTVHVEDTLNNSDNRTVTAAIRPVVYASATDDTEIVYTMGAVLRDDGASATMLSEPGFSTDGRRAVLPLVVTHQRADTRTGLGGSTTILVVAFRQSKSPGTPFVTNASAQANVSITVESPRVDAWKAYFESQGYSAHDPGVGDGEVTYYFRTDRLYVPRTQIEIALTE